MDFLLMLVVVPYLDLIYGEGGDTLTSTIFSGALTVQF